MKNFDSATTRPTGQQDALEELVRHAFQLRPAFRKAYLLCEIQGLTIAEAATILGISHPAVALRLARARREISLRLLVSGRSRSSSEPSPSARPRCVPEPG